MDTNGYYVDLTTFRLETLKERLSHIHLSPSQQVLLEDMDARFAVLSDAGFENLQQLRDVIKTKKALEKFAAQIDLPIDFLTHLRRWVNGYFPKPVKLADLSAVDPDAIAKLAEMGIKDTLQLFPRIKTARTREALEIETGIAPATILILAKYTDLVRLKWVGPKFAHLLIVSGFDTAEKVASADGEALYAHLKKVSAEKKVYHGGFSLDDIRLWVAHIVCDVPICIQYE